MAEHTPGPWKVVFGSCVHTDDGQYVAELSSPRGEAQRTVDAHLIAAAPDLLRDLTTLIAMVEDFLTDPTQDRDHVLTQIDGCRSTLAKATALKGAE